MTRVFDEKYYMNRPVNVLEQNMFMNQEPYIERLETFYGIQDIEENTRFILKTNSSYFNLKPFQIGDVIRIKLFFKEVDDTTNIALEFPQINKTYTFNHKVLLHNNVYLVLKLVDNQGVECFEIIDSEIEPMDAKYQNFCVINETINQAIAIIEKYLDFSIVYQHIEILVEDYISEMETLFKKPYDELTNEQIECFLNSTFDIMYSNEKIVSNKKIEYVGKSLIIKSLSADFGYQKNNFPMDLKRAIQDHTNFLYNQKGAMIYFGNSWGTPYGSFEFSDTTKNILNSYKNLGV